MQEHFHRWIPQRSHAFVLWHAHFYCGSQTISRWALIKCWVERATGKCLCSGQRHWNTPQSLWFLIMEFWVQLYCLNRNRGLWFLSGGIGNKVTVSMGFAYCTTEITDSMGWSKHWYILQSSQISQLNICYAFIPFIMVLEAMILIDNIAFSHRVLWQSRLKHIYLLVTFIFNV